MKKFFDESKFTKEARIDAALERGDHIVICGGRGYQKKLIQNYIFAKQFPKGKVAIISPDGIRESESADYEEIETKLKQAMKEENPIVRYELSRWNNHFEASLNIQEVSEEIRKLMAEGFENDIKALKQKIWDYMAEHPTKDRGVIISHETHNLILEEVGYGDGVNAYYMYAKKFHFEMKESYIDKLLRI